MYKFGNTIISLIVMLTFGGGCNFINEIKEEQARKRKAYAIAQQKKEELKKSAQERISSDRLLISISKIGTRMFMGNTKK